MIRKPTDFARILSPARRIGLQATPDTCRLHVSRPLQVHDFAWLDLIEAANAAAETQQASRNIPRVCSAQKGNG